MDLMEDYKKEPGGKEKLNERNPKWINDDYVKFLRYGQHFIERNGEGVLAFINPHGYLDNPTFRGMRWNLLKTYDKIYALDLHGNSKKKETAQDGTADMNVFDIMQGVSINIFVKTGKKRVNELGKVYHFDLYGKREMKYDFLFGSSLVKIEYKELPNVAPNYFFVGKNFEEQKIYNKGFSVDELFILNNVGIVTSRDSFVIDDDKNVLAGRLIDFFQSSKEDIQKEYQLKENTSWKINEVKQKAITFDANSISKVSYRPFDDRFIYYNNEFIERSRTEVMQHFLKGENIGIDLCRQLVSENYYHIFITNKIVDDSFVSNKTRERGYVFPLFRYPDNNGQQSIDQSKIRTSNLNQGIVKNISEKLGLTFTCEKDTNQSIFASIDVLDYIYAFLHSPSYRRK
jgi:predicted helicase